MKGYKMNKILVSSFAFAISASLLSKPIQAAEDQNNNISTDAKDNFAGTDDMGRSNFAPSISDLYNIDVKEDFDTNVKNDNTIKSELSADKLNLSEKEESVNDGVLNKESTDTPSKPDNSSDEDTSDLNEHNNTGESSIPDQPNEDESTPSESDNPSDEETSGSNENNDTGEPSTPDQPNEDDGSTPSEPDNPS